MQNEGGGKAEVIISVIPNAGLGTKILITER